MKSQKTTTKTQPNKSEAPISKFHTFPASDSNFGIWHLFVIWLFGICGFAALCLSPFSMLLSPGERLT
jgi:hypothetical protein